jgi:lambda repressor-like predicted transcriptional regulator/phage repressor protein C with HTH and peptisase S24 domain
LTSHSIRIDEILTDIKAVHPKASLLRAKLTKGTTQDWHPEEIKAAIRKTGMTLSDLSRSAGFSDGAAKRALLIPWPRIEVVIATRLGLKPEEIWPSRYTPEGLPKAGLHIERPGTVSDARGTEQSMTNAAQTNRWFTLAELAALDLPGIPTTRRGLALQAQREEWDHPAAEGRLWRRRQGRGGGIEYWIGVLPSFTQAKLLAKEAAQNPAPARDAALRQLSDDAAWQAYERASDKHKQRAAKRVAALDALETLVLHGRPRSLAIMEVAATHDVSRAALYAWVALVDGVPRAHWLARLVPQYVGTKGPRAACDDDAWEWLRARYLLPNRPTFESCFRDLQQVAAQKGWRLPSAQTLRRRISKFTKSSFRKNDRMGAKSEGESESTTSPSGEISLRLERAIAQAGGPSAVARRAEMYLGTLNRYRAGRELPSSALVSLARATGVRLEWLATGEGPMQADQEVVTTSAPLPGYVLLPLMETRAATGNNGDLSGNHNVNVIAFSEVWLRETLRRTPQNLALLIASGYSMDPTIRDGDLLLVDTAVRHIEGSEIYVLAIGGAFMVKRIQVCLDASVVMKSDNAFYDSEVVPADQVATLIVLGKVIWLAGPVRALKQ